MSFTILKICNVEERGLFRKLERASLKLVKTLEHLKFNDQCLQHSLLPTYSNIRTHDATARSQPLVVNFRKNLIQRQIDIEKGRLSEINLEITGLTAALKETCTTNLRYESFISFLDRIKEKTLIEQSSIHERKLCQLNGGRLPIKNDTYFYNLTDEKFSEDVKDAFKLGLGCHLRTKPSNLVKKMEIEKLYSTLKTKERLGELHITNDEILRTELKRYGLSNKPDFTKDVLTRDQYKKLKQIKSV